MLAADDDDPESMVNVNAKQRMKSTAMGITSGRVVKAAGKTGKGGKQGRGGKQGKSGQGKGKPSVPKPRKNKK
jgi:hypothetical protein